MSPRPKKSAEESEDLKEEVKKAKPKAASKTSAAKEKTTKAEAKKADQKAKVSSKKQDEAPTLSNKSSFKNAKTVDRKWHLIDAKDQNLGRLSTEIARILRGKRKPSYTPNVDAGDFVVVINAKDISFKGKNKGEQTVYRRYTGYPGGLRSESLNELLKRIPERVIYNTVKGMMPKTKLGNAQLTKLKIYAGSEHPHQAQKPVTLSSIPTV